MTDEKLNEKIHAYHALKRYRETVDERLEKLNKEIKEEVMGRNDVTDIHPGDTLNHAFETDHGTYVATIHIKQLKPRIDDVQLAQLIVDKRLQAECMTLQVDKDLVEQAFLEGKLTDQDLRDINGGSNVSLALKVDRVVKQEDV